MASMRAAAIAVVVLAMAEWAPAEESKSATTQPASAEQIARWVRDLDAGSAAVRDAAGKALVAAGTSAVKPVARAAKGKSLEVTVRGVAVLKALLASDDAATRQAARSALEGLAENTNHPAGQEATKALGTAGGAPPNRAGGLTGQIMAQMKIGGAGAVRQMSVRNSNGRKEIDVTENGRKVCIVEDKNGIVVKVTDKPEGEKKPKPKEYKAADAAALKKKHPEAYKLYEKYAKQQGGAIVLNFGNIRVGPGVGIAAAAAPANAPRAGVRTRRLIDQASLSLRKALARLEAAKTKPLDAKAMAELVAQVRSVQAKLAEARKSLPR